LQRERTGVEPGGLLALLALRGNGGLIGGGLVLGGDLR
jgi:hypothetical protein